MTDWDARFLDLAEHVATWSKDPSTKVGAVLVGTNYRDIAVGYNGFPPGVSDREERLHDRATRHALTQHAERNVLDNARFDARGATLYVTRFPCLACARSIVSKGVVQVFCPLSPDRAGSDREGEAAIVRDLFEEVGIELWQVR